MATKVTLRSKKISKGRKSLYLDFYPPIKHPLTGKSTRREFLGLYIFERSKSPFETQHNKETKILAESIKHQRYLEIQNGTYGNKAQLHQDMDYLEFFRGIVKSKYSSKGNYDSWKSVYRHLETYFEKGLTMGEISERNIEGFKGYLESLNLAQNTKHSYFNKFRTSIKEAYQKGFLHENYSTRVKGIKAEETKREFLTLEEIKMLLPAECEIPVLKDAFLFSAFTGLRFSDIKNLKWTDIQGNNSGGYFIRYRQKKTKGEETLPISIPARQFMGKKGSPEEKVFKGLSYSAWNNLKLRDWVQKAGINKHITFHCARHSFATLYN